MTSRVASVVKRHPQITFFVLAYAVAWAFVPFGSFGAFGPLVAALVVIPYPGLGRTARARLPVGSLASALVLVSRGFGPSPSDPPLHIRAEHRSRR